MAKPRRKNLIQLRVTDEEKELLEAAAELTGRTHTSIILDGVQRVYIEASLADRRRARRNRSGDKPPADAKMDDTGQDMEQGLQGIVTNGKAIIL